MTEKIPVNPASRTLFEFLAARRLTVAEVARAAGISEGTLRAYRDIEGRGINSRTLHKVLGAIAHLSGTSETCDLSVPEHANGENAQCVCAPPAVSRTPDSLAAPGGPEFAAPAQNAQGVYALFVEDDTMVPRYEPGELIFVSPHRPASSGDDVVIVRRNGNGEQIAAIKRLLRRGGEEIVAEQFNPYKEIRFAAGEIDSIHLVLRMADLYGY